MYSGFERKINISVGVEDFPDWIIDEDGDASTSVNSFEETSDGDASLSVNLRPNLSHNYLGMILCFDLFSVYSVKTSASNIFESYTFSSNIVIVPRSIFRVTDTDHTITFASTVDRRWIHLLYKNEDNSITLNVADEGNTSSLRPVKQGTRAVTVDFVARTCDRRTEKYLETYNHPLGALKGRDYWQVHSIDEMLPPDIPHKLRGRPKKLRRREEWEGGSRCRSSQQQGTNLQRFNSKRRMHCRRCGEDGHQKNKCRKKHHYETTRRT
ncbi:hypothetical protein DCAR_0100644 [Daucus carota subsp. sativus]|uniref:CCHC-type domain-containing protein n=1 Tax=Daucus carota subsp. sativus TaxID=79200 RepID=A0A162AZS3_DAUCS|nr:hypothetical protein DCAR_0100644 [Daucus carota subsp. sativus]